MTKHKWMPWAIRALILALIFANIYMIFMFSSEDGKTSGARSEYVADKVAPVIDKDYVNKTETEKKETVKELQFSVRKLAHITEYASLSFLVCLLLASFKLPLYVKMPAPVIFAFVCATVDELVIQAAVKGRYGAFTDVLIDSAGAVGGMLLATLIVFIFVKIIQASKKRLGVTA